MRANRGKDTGPEWLIRRALFARGWRYRVDHRIGLPSLVARPDIVFPRRRVAVFVDGCFWHGCPSHGTWPKKNGPYWRAKIERNRERDLEQTKAMTAAGWTVVRVWEHEATSDAITRIERALGVCIE